MIGFISLVPNCKMGETVDQGPSLFHVFKIRLNDPRREIKSLQQQQNTHKKNIPAVNEEVLKQFERLGKVWGTSKVCRSFWRPLWKFRVVQWSQEKILSKVMLDSSRRSPSMDTKRFPGVQLLSTVALWSLLSRVLTNAVGFLRGGLLPERHSHLSGSALSSCSEGASVTSS